MIRFEQHPDIAMNKAEFDPAVHKAVYMHDYKRIFSLIANKYRPEREMFRSLVLDDLFFIVMFVMGIEKANHPFVVQAAQDLQLGPKTGTLDIWAREHFKSTTITQAETLQYHLRLPEHCTGIFSYVRPVAKAFLRSNKILCEQNEWLKWLFQDILWNKPESEAPKWSEDDGLIFKRQSASRKESTIEAWGLIEGMPTSRHFERRIYDDIETDDIRDSPDMLTKCYSKFEMSDNLGVDGGIERVTGTFYSHFGPLVKIRDKKDEQGNPMYVTRIKAATHDGTKDGKPVLLSQERLNKLKMSQHFNSQQLCDPTPLSDIKLDPTMLKPIEPQFIPRDVYKFMVLDQAGGDETDKQSIDKWSFACIAIEPLIDDIGQSNVYLLDVEADKMSHGEGIDGVTRMYLRNGMIMQMGVEKVGLSTTEIHIANALRARGRRLSQEAGNLVLLRPANRSKEKRVESALQWPLDNGKIHYSRAIPKKYIDGIIEEMMKFPFFHVDILDMIAYAYDMFKEYRFQPIRQEDNSVNIGLAFQR